MKPLGWLALAAACVTGCASRQLPPTDLTAPGWTQQHVEAVWRPREGAPELVGELLVATHPDGSRWVQFSKQGLPLVLARTTPSGWTLQSPLRSRGLAGRGPAPDRGPWFQLDHLPPSPPASNRWRLTLQADGSWRLAHPRRGEVLEGFP
jgi:hypothetical protein